jgi:DNA ligase (NAD+)
VWSVGRTGQCTPTGSTSPRELSGVTVSNVLFHHAGKVRDFNLGKGAIIKITRGGEVVPFLLDTIQGVTPEIITNCPSCNHVLTWENDTLYCRGTQCSPQIENQLNYHFSIIGAKGWADKTIEKLVLNGFDSIEKLQTITHSQLTDIGFGAGVAKNLINERERVINTPIKDYILLASLAVSNLGRGTSKKLLAEFRIDKLEAVTPERLLKLSDFGDVTSVGISDALKERTGTIDFLLNIGFIIEHTQDIEQVENGTLEGLNVCFTGSMIANRTEMERVAVEVKGAKSTQSSCTGKTDLLVMGSGVGQKKLDGAEKHGVTKITEAEYNERY